MADPSSSFPEPLAGLVRDHREAETVLGQTRAALDAAVAAPAETALTVEALSRLYLLRDFLDVDLSLHIAKEEEILFPALHDQSAEAAALVGDMVAEHDMVREQQRSLADALDGLDGDGVPGADSERSLPANGPAVPPTGLAATIGSLRQTVTELDWILQGHFTGEEDGLFLPAAESLPPAFLAGLATRMATMSALPGPNP